MSKEVSKEGVRYRIQRKLGEGGSSETFLVWDMRLERSWVMKRLLLHSKSQWEALQREVSVLRRVHKEGIPMLADLFYEGNSACMILEYLSGMTLEEKVSKEGTMTEREAAAYGLQAAELISCLHHLSPAICHGDMKPQNLLYQGGRAALLDFGSAVSAEGGSWQEEAEGCFLTPGYDAPELRKGGRVSVRSDVYAFGAVLFYLVTGEHPGGSRGIYPVREQRQELSAEWEALLLRCMREDPRERFGSMEEARLVLEQILQRKKEKRRKKTPVFLCLQSVLLTEGTLGRNDIG